MSAAAGLLQGIHVVIATRRGQHWLLSDDEAKHYGGALSNALRHLPVTMAQKYVDFTALAVAVCMYEAPRIAIDMGIRRQMQQQAAAQRANGQAGQAYAMGPIAPNSEFPQ